MEFEIFDKSSGTQWGQPSKLETNPGVEPEEPDFPLTFKSKAIKGNLWQFKAIEGSEGRYGSRADRKAD